MAFLFASSLRRLIFQRIGPPGELSAREAQEGACPVPSQDDSQKPVTLGAQAPEPPLTPWHIPTQTWAKSETRYHSVYETKGQTRCGRG